MKLYRIEWTETATNFGYVTTDDIDSVKIWVENNLNPNQHDWNVQKEINRGKQVTKIEEAVLTPVDIPE